jgi:uncharacterized protein (AIM24 family)
MATPTTLPGTFSAGAVLTASQMNNLRGAFRILQLSVVETNTQQISTSTTYADVTGGSITITPSATTNKILIVSADSFLASGNPADCGVRFLRGSTNIFTSVQAILGSNGGGSFVSIYLDSPSTTSATTYKVQFNRDAGTGVVYHSIANTKSTFLVAEISA